MPRVVDGVIESDTRCRSGTGRATVTGGGAELAGVRSRPPDRADCRDTTGRDPLRGATVSKANPAPVASIRRRADVLTRHRRRGTDDVGSAMTHALMIRVMSTY